MNILNRLQAAVLAILMLGHPDRLRREAPPPEGRPALATLSGSPPSP